MNNKCNCVRGIDIFIKESNEDHCHITYMVGVLDLMKILFYLGGGNTDNNEVEILINCHDALDFYR